jgi:hypothetical protein
MGDGSWELGDGRWEQENGRAIALPNLQIRHPLLPPISPLPAPRSHLIRNPIAPTPRIQLTTGDSG